MVKEYQICSRCIMDTTDPDIEFDKNGRCNHCRAYEEEYKNYIRTDEKGQEEFQKLITEIKEYGKNKDYDCVMGLSGGVDSSYVAYQSKQLGLRPLAIHFDNNWNAELAVKNIENIVKKLGIDLITYVIDWEEFKDLQLSFLKASVVDIEVLTDHAIMAALFKTAKERKIKYILSGANIVTEVIMPKAWAHAKWDIKNIKAIQKRFGKKEIKNFPVAGYLKQAKYKLIDRIKFIQILNYLPYIKKDVKALLERELKWRDYGGKHYESIFTRFYQGYILPKKFNIDKRKAHLSTLICSGQITREEALEEMKKEIYPREMLKEDKEYVLKKFGLSKQEFEEIMSLPIKAHEDYPSNKPLYERLLKIKRTLQGLPVK